MNSILKIPSFGKINRSLRIVGKRSDGYHEIDTILQTISLHDDLTFKSRDDERVVLHCNQPDIPTDQANLIVQAALALKNLTSQSLGADIDLVKRIPAQGGLGGASSNSAVALLALNHLWDLGLDVSRLQQIGAALGADVPFFFLGGSARGEGTGTKLSMLPDSEQSLLVVITPNAKVSTAGAYNALKAPSLTSEGSVSILSSSFAGPVLSDYNQWPLYNDFEGVIFEIEPEIKRAKSALFDAGAQGALLAGSGSSVFGIFRDENTRERALERLECENGWQVFSCETLSRKEYFARLNLPGFPIRSLNFQTDTGA